MYSINNNNIYLITELKPKLGSVIIKLIVNNLEYLWQKRKLQVRPNY